MDRTGEIAAFGTAICWTLSAIWFERATKRVGVLAVNFWKVAFATVFLALLAWATRGSPLPLDAPPRAWLFLSLSGLVGFVIADIFLFSAYALIGSRVTMLFLALSPPMTALLGYVFLGESIGLKGAAGMALVAAGIALATLGKRQGSNPPPLAGAPIEGAPHAGHPTRGVGKGYLFAFLSSVGQSVGMILSKQGLGDYSVVAGTQIRVAVGMAGFLAVSLAWDRGRSLKAALGNRVGMGSTLAGAVFGPFIGVTLSLFAVQRANAGVVSALIGLTPVLIIPPSIILFGQKVRAAEILGAVVAVAGSAVFFL